MENEHLSEIELIRSGQIKGREALEILSRSNDYLFHGSDKKIDKLEPRQAYDWSSGERKPDGEPAVFAADDYEVAVFMAVRKGLSGKSGFSKKKGDEKFSFRMSKELADNLAQEEDRKGYIMVIPREDFSERAEDWYSEKEVIPEFIVEVTKKDMPTNIEISENY